VVEADGGSRGNPGPAGYGAVVRDAGTGPVLAERAASIGRATNNVAEYGGLIAGLEAATELAPSAVEVRMDSKLVVEQMSGRWQIKHPDMKPLAARARELLRGLPRTTFTWVPRAANAHADRLANEAMDAAATGRVWAAPGDGGAANPGHPNGVAGRPEVGVGPNRLSGWMDPPAPPVTTVLLRHGQTALSVDKRFCGTSDPPLTPEGLAQARAAARRLARRGDLAAIVSSPLTRARETADAAGLALGLPVQLDDGLAETDFGDWEGYTFAEVRERWPAELDAWLASVDVAPPYGESFAATTRRVRRARDRLLSSYPGRGVLVVSHVTPIKTLVRLALDAPPAALYRMHLDLACLSEVDWYADGPAVLRSLNDTAHLAGVPAQPAADPSS